MKYTTRFFTLFCITLILLALTLIAAAPHQTVTPPPVTATPAVVAVPPIVVDPIGGIVDQIGTFVIALLIAGVAWLIAQVRELKERGISIAHEITPDNWDWLIEREAEILVKAARQLYPPAQTQKMLEYVQGMIFETLKSNNIPITPVVTDKVRAIIEAAVFDLYAEFPEAKPSAKPPALETTNAK